MVNVIAIPIVEVHILKHNVNGMVNIVVMVDAVQHKYKCKKGFIPLKN